MPHRTLTLVDDQPIVGTYGEVLTSMPLQVPSGFHGAEWVIRAADFLGQTAIQLCLQEGCAPTSWRVLQEFDLHDEVIHTRMLFNEDPRTVRAQVQIKSVEDPYAEWADSSAYMRLTVQLALTEKERK